MLTDIGRYIRKHWQRPNNGLMQIIIINAVVFVALLLLRVVLVVGGYGAYYTALQQSLVLPSSWEAFKQQPWSLLTHGWVNIHLFSIFWTVLILKTFGQVIQDLLNSRYCWRLYWLGTVVGGSCFLLLYNWAPPFRGVNAYLLGTEGSMYAMMAAAAMMAPRHPFRLLFIGTVQLRYIVGFAVFSSLYMLANEAPAAGAAQLGGALAGYGYIQFALLRVALSEKIRLYRQKKRQTFRVSYSSDAAVTESMPKAPVDQVLIDEILDKVAASGYDSLTSEEKHQLFRAGQ